jgi:hypothetical protein
LIPNNTKIDMKLRTARFLDKGILLVATLLLAGRQYSIPSGSFWNQGLMAHKYVPLMLIVTAGVFGTLTPIETLSRRSRSERGVTLRRVILATFGQLLELGRSVQPPLDVSDLGLHIWQKKRTLRRPITGELSRLSTYRLGSVPATRHIRPTKGVGVVGLCWQKDQEIGFNVAELAAQLSGRQEFDRYASDNGRDAVMGFSWEDFQRLSHRGAVFASPIRNGGSRFVGCISFDAERGYGELVSNRLWHQLNSLCMILGQEGFEFV